MDRTETTTFTTEACALVAAALGAPTTWRPATALGDTLTHLTIWDIWGLDTLHARATAPTTVTAKPTTRTADGAAYDIVEITLTVDVPGVGPVTAVTDWDPRTEADATSLPVCQTAIIGASL